jgi:lipopolysaccharide heptosyltransferase I
MPVRPPLSECSAERVVLIKPSALGDIVHTLPVLSALRRRFPRAHICWVVNRSYEPLLVGHPDLDATLPFDRAAARGGWLGAARTFASFFRTLRAHRFDLAIDLQGLLRSGLMSRATGAARRVGLATAREASRFCCTDVVPLPRAGMHAVDRYWCVAEALGAGSGPKAFHVPVQQAAAAWAAETLHGLPRPRVVVGAGSRWRTKRWPPEHFAELARRARGAFGGSAVFIGGLDELALSAAVRSRLDGPSLDLTGRTALPQLAAILARADVVLANDTGPLHLAAALGRPVVAPYTCTRAAWTGPYGMAHCAVETRVWCAGSCRKRCSRMECMAELTPDRLWPVLREVLQSWQSRRIDLGGPADGRGRSA